MKQSDDEKKEKRKYFISVAGEKCEITKEIYEVFYRMDRRERYLEERDFKKGVIIFSDMKRNYCSAEGIIPDKNTDIETEVINKVLMETVLEAISILNEEEKWLIQELFFFEKSQRQLSKETGLPLMTISNRKKRVLEKLRKYLKIEK
ncbi:sigma-70 family RNA polymerase sigma factor [Fusibacter ferrireducens]|uniref:Sigma-70 family RNA polymerase sigma factor n=1 Tax=Fusibacter ferrireducens TaxID=2785058 RepID=A0ABR9ZP79_9FIRM|nr:sigma-70 family RNA polymerase sigma factor [Fusibacter ferrireducens]MBF4692261.1 sigma-70 family RNA polymerase sigma factor [Fusibacter ferrireducens]